MRKLILLLMLCPILSTVKAQKFPVDGMPSHQQSLNFNLGTQGLGLEYRYGLNAKFNLRGGFNLLPVNANNVFQVSGFNSNSSVSAKFSSLHAFADFTPFNGAQFFRLVAGAGYFIKAQGHALMQPTDNYKYGDIALTQQQVGNLNMDINWQGVAPYFGFGLAHAFPRNKFSINADLGTYYLTRPSGTITGTGILAGNSTQSGQFQKNISNYRWYPQLAIGFNYKF